MPLGVVGGIIAGGALAGAGTLGAAAISSRASSKATAAAVAANQDNIQLARENRSANTALYAPDLTRGAYADSVLDSLYGLGGVLPAPSGSVGQMTYASSPVGGAGGIDVGRILRERPDVVQEAARVGMAPETYAELWYNQVRPAAGDPYQLTYADPGTEATTAQAPVYNQGELQSLYKGTEPYKLGEQAYADTDALIGQSYADVQGELGAGRARADEEAQTAYNTRRGFTTTALQDLEALRDLDEQRGTDRIASTIGVDGMIGKAARAVADQSYARNLEFSSTKRGWENEDFDPFAETRDRNLQTYNTGSLANMENRDARRFNNLDTRAGNRQRTYGDWEGYVRGVSGRGQTGRNAIAGFTGDYTQAASNANSASAQAYGQNAMNQANIWGGAAQNIAGIAGDVVGAWNYNRKPKTYAEPTFKPRTSGTSSYWG